MQNKSGDIKRNHKEANARSFVTKDSNAIIQQTDFFVIVQLRARQTLKTPLARKHARVPYILSARFVRIQQSKIYNVTATSTT